MTQLNNTSILSNAVSGMSVGSSQLQATTNKIVNANLSNYRQVQVRNTVPKTNPILHNRGNFKDIDPESVNEILNLMRIHPSYTANAKLVQISEEFVGSLLDVMY